MTGLTAIFNKPYSDIPYDPEHPTWKGRMPISGMPEEYVSHLCYPDAPTSKTLKISYKKIKQTGLYFPSAFHICIYTAQKVGDQYLNKKFITKTPFSNRKDRSNPQTILSKKITLTVPGDHGVLISAKVLNDDESRKEFYYPREVIQKKGELSLYFSYQYDEDLEHNTISGRKIK